MAFFISPLKKAGVSSCGSRGFVVVSGAAPFAQMPYQPIEDYGVVGNLRTTALAGKNGSIDWFCFPHFDSPSVFGAILDDRRGGYFQIAPTIDEISRKQVY